MAKIIQFNPNDDYTFWFWKDKFEFVLETLGILIDYDFDEDEIKELRISLSETDSEANHNNWIGGLFYGKKDVFYMKLAQNRENLQMIYIFLAFDKNLKERIEFIDILQNNYSKLFKY